MTSFKHRINTSVLPGDILSYNDTQFYNVVKRFVCNDAADLLEFQAIRNADSLVLIPDVFAILNINCAALQPLKEKLCLKSDDDISLVKPGIKSLMNYFCELIIKKLDEELKLLNKRQSSSTTSVSNIVTMSSTTNVSPMPQQQLTSTTPTSAAVSLHTTSLNEKYHRNFIINSIHKWCNKHSANLSLTEGNNYHLTVIFTDINEIAKIKCGCGSRVSLVKIRKHFQLSNFYKHLTSSSCSIIHKESSTTVTNEIGINENDSSDSNNSSSQDAVSLSTVPSTNKVSFLNKSQNNRKRAASPNITNKKQIKSP
ncbi:unnamed protein product [Rotaria sp. Silwood1]|nr:unnamed protein product [Rotaria sp. Silwood1]CAF1310560.1 unnamed protein product [Rotaria sp. Silwood1]CAF3421401.1 unnamed protein product [Rotaria sp. Silwood1]CAF3519323.1 unnamed protein product [Rotaria sp. Silwood1]CAF3549577.1 unnamed protein product [Rotaria sp. Silwood1]